MKGPIAVLSLLALVSCAGQQTGGPPDAPSGAPTVVEVRPSTPASASVGDSVELTLSLEIADGFHIQANPASQPYLIPALLELEAADGLEPGPPVYPPGSPYRLQGTDEDLATYDGGLTIAVPVRIRQDAAPGDRSLGGTFRYQACNARQCLAPATIPVELGLRLEPPR